MHVFFERSRKLVGCELARTSRATAGTLRVTSRTRHVQTSYGTGAYRFLANCYLV